MVLNNAMPSRLNMLALAATIAQKLLVSFASREIPISTLMTMLR
jgi:hypothetical protein